MSQLSIETPSHEDTRLPLQQSQLNSSSALSELLGLEVSPPPLQDIFQQSFQQQQQFGNLVLGQQMINSGKTIISK